MKKYYVKPAIEAIEVQHEALMMTVSGEQDNVGTGDGTAGDDTPGLSRERRGSWGNLWE